MKKFAIVAVAVAALSVFGAVGAFATPAGNGVAVEVVASNAGANEEATSGQSEVQAADSAAKDQDTEDEDEDEDGDIADHHDGAAGNVNGGPADTESAASGKS